MPSKRAWLTAASCSIAALLVRTPATAQPRPRRIGFVESGSQRTNQGDLDAFLGGMAERGWQPGRDIVVMPVFADNRIPMLPELIRGLIEQGAEVIVAGDPPATRVAHQVTRSVPIVMVNVGTPVAMGLIASLARPGGNVTGLSPAFGEFLVKNLELLHELSPRARRMAILLSENLPTHAERWQTAQRTCAARGLEAIRVTANSMDAFAPATETIAQEGAHAVMVVADTTFDDNRQRVVELVNRLRIPAAYGWPFYVQHGGLLSYATDIHRNYAYSSGHVDRILRGAVPADLPVEQPSHYQLAINLSTARSLGLTIPPSVMVRATTIVQ